MNNINPTYKKNIDLITSWVPDINNLYFSYVSKVSAPASSLLRWNSTPLALKQEIVDAIFSVNISPFFGCSSRYKSAPPPCMRKKANTSLGVTDCMDGLIADVEAACRQAQAPEYCRKIFLPTISSSSFSCSDARRKSLDAFVLWLYSSAISSKNGYIDTLQSRYMSDSSPKITRWK